MVKNQNLEKLVEEKGWQRKPIGYYRSSGQTKEIEGYYLYVRKTLFDDFFKKSSFSQNQNTPKNSINTEFSELGSQAPMGSPKDFMTPSEVCSTETVRSFNSGGLQELSHFSDFPSLMSARPDKPCILIGFDSEWQDDLVDRDMLSWQFAVVWDGYLIEFVFIKNGDKNLDLNLAFGCILDYLGIPPVDVRKIRRYKYCCGWLGNKPVEIVTDNVNVARRESVFCYKNGRFTQDYILDQPDRNAKRSARSWSWFHTYLDYDLAESVKVTLVCHKGIVDISGLNCFGDAEKGFCDDIYNSNQNLLLRLSDVQGGLVTLNPVRISLRSIKNPNNIMIYPVSLTVSDTMCHAPSDKKSLTDLGHAVGIEKYDLPSSKKEHMKDLLEQEPITFFEYASKDSVVTLLYASSLYGYNNTPPITITSACARVMKNMMMDYLGCSNTAEFNRKYRGLVKVSHGLEQLKNKPGYIENSSLEPINDNVNTVLYMGSQSYHGGYNSCTEVGIFLKETHDYDLKNAYPTAMCLVPDIDWENPIKLEVRNRLMTLEDFNGTDGVDPVMPFVGYVKFEFPETVKYPCIPINVNGVPVYPRTSDGLDGVYVAGSYVYLALVLGAKVWCERGYFLNTLYTIDHSQKSFSMAYAIKQLVVDRNEAKKRYGKGSLEELILKVMVNSVYGKSAQNVIDKQTWSAFKDTMVDIGCSAITNPISATMTTSIVQCVLLAAQNQLHELGYMTCSVTTDGFISDCPLEVLVRLDLYGFKKVMSDARIYLTGNDPSLWERKHCQDDLVNFTTRGNVSLHHYVKDELGQPVYNLEGSIVGYPMMLNDKPYDGVCAHNSVKSGYKSDSYEDRYWLMTQVLGRTGKVKSIFERWYNLKDVVKLKTWMKVPDETNVRMDFDLKRKPDRKSFCTDYVTIDGIKYEMAHFDTVPYENVEEFRLYRQKKELVDVLRTVKDWELYFMKVDSNVCNVRVCVDKEWSVLMSCIMGYRAGRWDIPGLTACKSNEEKYAWINKHNKSQKRFKESDWKNCRRQDRQVNMLPIGMIQDKLNELIDDIE